MDHATPTANSTHPEVEPALSASPASNSKTSPRLRRALTAAVQNPRRLLTALAALAAIAWAGWLIGRQWWARHHWRAAQEAVVHYHYIKAKHHLQRCSAVWPNDRDLLLLGARVARRLRMFDDAESLLTLYHQSHGEDDGFLLERVLLRGERGDLDGVNVFCRTLLDQDHPQSSVILEALVGASLRAYRLNDAEALIQRWQKWAPDDAQAEYSRGFLAELHTQKLEAVKAYRRAVDCDAEHVEARFRLASVLLDLSQAQEAMTHLRWLVERHPNYVSVLVDIARASDQLGRQDDAEQFLRSARDVGPRYAEAWLESGALALRRDQLENAEAWLRRACELEPANYRSHFQLSLCLERLGKADEARTLAPRLKKMEEDNVRQREIVSQLMPRTPNDPNLHWELGAIALRAGSIDEALQWFDSALKIDPKHAPTHEAYASYYQASGQIGRAARHRDFVKPKADNLSSPPPRNLP